jgi:ribosome-associated toxin RatA of RatAB toxin-antitoxin module
MPAATHSEDIGATPEACFAAVVDMPSYPEWQSAVHAVEVLATGSDARPEVVRFGVDLQVRTVSYTLRYAYEHPHRISWTYVEGDVADIVGAYDFLPTPDGGGTRATYALEIDLGFPVPGFVLRRVTSTAMRRSVRELKTRVER